MRTTPKRRYLHVVYDRKFETWKVRETAARSRSSRGVILATYGRREWAWIKARDLGHAMHRNGCLVQVVFHRKDGRIIGDATYGRDPRRSKG